MCVGALLECDAAALVYAVPNPVDGAAGTVLQLAAAPRRSAAGSQVVSGIRRDGGGGADRARSTAAPPAPDRLGRRVRPARADGLGSRATAGRLCYPLAAERCPSG